MSVNGLSAGKLYRKRINANRLKSSREFTAGGGESRNLKPNTSISFVFNRVRIRVVVQEHNAFANSCPPHADTFLF